MLRTLTKIFLGTTLLLSTIGFQLAPAQDDEELGSDYPDTTITLLRKAYRVRGLSMMQKVGESWDTVAVFPQLPVASLLNYRPTHLIDGMGIDTARSDWSKGLHTESWIHAVTVAENRLWVGFAFYDGEGWEGVGGIGFYDPKSGALGILRQPDIVDNSISELIVTRDTIYAKTYHDFELSGTLGAGVVAINRNTLEATRRVPPGKDILFDKDDSAAVNPRYSKTLADLLADPAVISEKATPWPEIDHANIKHLGPERFMIETAKRDKQISATKRRGRFDDR